jgi:CheY-like chemotaxis protein
MEDDGHIWLTAEVHGADLVLKVRDTGIGIAADFLPRVFDLFFQAEHGVGRAQGGLGIGLTLVRRLVEMHGGCVSAHSAGVGKGSEFVVRLPGVLQSQDGVLPKREADQAPPAPVGPRRRILVVDDNVDAAESLAMLLGHMGQDVRVAHDGLAALKTVQVFRPQLVFLDLGMPGMDGFEVARRVRKQFGREKPVLIALTGWGQDEDRRRTRESGFDDHLVKPVEPQTLQQVLLTDR